MLTKEECIGSLNYFRKNVCSVCAGEYPHCWAGCLSESHYSKLEQLINEHFELQLTANECDLIILGLMKLENELGWDVTLLIKKVLKHKYIVPSTEGSVECVEIG